jgi:hypothetical protein
MFAQRMRRARAVAEDMRTDGVRRLNLVRLACIANRLCIMACLEGDRLAWEQVSNCRT